MGDIPTNHFDPVHANISSPWGIFIGQLVNSLSWAAKPTFLIGGFYIAIVWKHIHNLNSRFSCPIFFDFFNTIY